jgi:hypothetical protein
LNGHDANSLFRQPFCRINEEVKQPNGKMKTTIAVIGLCVAITGHAPGQTNHVDSPSIIQQPIKKSADELVTKTGVVYKKFKIEKSDPSGLVISYAPDKGGIGIAKVPFNELSDELQQHYGYDRTNAAKFDLAQKQAMGQLREQLLTDDQKTKEKRAAEDAADAQAAKQKKEDELREREIAAKEKAATAAMIQASNPPVMIQQQQQQW